MNRVLELAADMAGYPVKKEVKIMKKKETELETVIKEAGIWIIDPKELEEALDLKDIWEEEGDDLYE